MRLANMETDYWRLLSGEERHAINPDSFWIPERVRREILSRGDAVKLMFEIEGVNDKGEIERGVERMWVIVAEKIGAIYIGILDNQPASVEPSDDSYLCFGAEVPFCAEHVIDIARPPDAYIEWQLNQEPERGWPREAP